MPEFYVGYLPIPPGLKRFGRRVSGSIALMAAAVGVTLILAQQPFAASVFEFQAPHDFQGVLTATPYPTLAIPAGVSWLLVGGGKHGFVVPAGLDGRTSRIRGERIFNEAERGIEVESVNAIGPGERPAEIDLGRVELTGEIVDSKCYFGVMNPGRGKVHRDCAVRCLSGGLPPALLARDAAGEIRTVLLANWRRDLLAHVAEPVTLRGRLARSAGRLILYLE